MSHFQTDDILIGTDEHFPGVDIAHCDPNGVFIDYHPLTPYRTDIATNYAASIRQRGGTFYIGHGTDIRTMDMDGNDTGQFATIPPDAFNNVAQFNDIALPANGDVLVFFLDVYDDPPFGTNKIARFSSGGGFIASYAPSPPHLADPQNGNIALWPPYNPPGSSRPGSYDDCTLYTSRDPFSMDVCSGSGAYVDWPGVSYTHYQCEVAPDGSVIWVGGYTEVAVGVIQTVLLAYDQGGNLVRTIDLGTAPTNSSSTYLPRNLCLSRDGTVVWFNTGIPDNSEVTYRLDLATEQLTPIPHTFPGYAIAVVRPVGGGVLMTGTVLVV